MFAVRGISKMDFEVEDVEVESVDGFLSISMLCEVDVFELVVLSKLRLLSILTLSGSD